MTISHSHHGQGAQNGGELVEIFADRRICGARSEVAREHHDVCQSVQIVLTEDDWVRTRSENRTSIQLIERRQIALEAARIQARADIHRSVREPLGLIQPARANRLLYMTSPPREGNSPVLRAAATASVEEMIVSDESGGV